VRGPAGEDRFYGWLARNAPALNAAPLTMMRWSLASPDACCDVAALQYKRGTGLVFGRHVRFIGRRRHCE
jgi:hypothetical protein